MNEELKITCDNLKSFSKLIKEKNKLEKKKKCTKEEYITKNARVSKPKKKAIKKVEFPTEPIELKINKKLISTISYIVAFVLFIITVLLSVETDSFFVIIIGVPIMIFSICYPIVIIQKKEDEYKKLKEIYEKDLKEANKICAENKKNEEYNRNYPELLRQYTEEVKKCENEYDAYIPLTNVLTNVALRKINEQIKQFDGLISPKYNNNIDEIVEIIKDGRADSLKEAINIFVSDSKQNELINAQIEANRLADKKFKDAQRHNLEMEAQARQHNWEMEEQARRQADAIKEQEDARRRGAPSCALCANYPCGGNPAYCGSFRKKA